MVRQMTEAHRQAVQAARIENRAVAAYLEAIEHNKNLHEQHRPKRGRRRTKESMQMRLDEIAGAIAGASPLKRVLLIQERMDLQRELDAATKPPPQPIDTSELEAEFVDVVQSFSNRKGVSYAAWREFGVTPSVLKQGGVRRTRRP